MGTRHTEILSVVLITCEDLLPETETPTLQWQGLVSAQAKHLVGQEWIWPDSAPLPRRLVVTRLNSRTNLLNSMLTPFLKAANAGNL